LGRPGFPFGANAYVYNFRVQETTAEILAKGKTMATETQHLELFVKESLQSGKTREEIAKALEGAGWPGAQIKNALEAFADIPFPIPVPKPRPSLTAREAFLYLVMFSTLYCAAWNLGSLLFIFIDRAFPEATSAFYPGIAQRWSTSAIIIAFPVFLLLARYINKQVALNPFKRLSPARRWLTYLTLFLASGTLLGDTTALLFNLLGGELTIRFVLKILVVALIAGSCFTYYLLDLRKEEKE
jgi:Domain of unknown function (DUF5671)